MSFSFNFSARTIAEANAKLHQVYAPSVVKALVEKALDAMPKPEMSEKPILRQAGASTGMTVNADQKASPQFLGVFVEVWGHFDESGHNKSEIQRFIVQPLWS
jgi:hypothetical protein